MKLTELLVNQKLIVQLLWGEQKIEFASEVLENDSTEVFISPYLHNGGALELDISQGKGVVCNIFTDDPVNRRRISWKNVELTTVTRNQNTMYLIKTYGFNNVAQQDDRRKHDRIVIHHNAKAQDYLGNTADIIVHDISDNGVSFFAPKSFEPKTAQLKVSWLGEAAGKQFDVVVDCTIARTTAKAGNKFIGCKINGDNKDFLLYCFLLSLKNKKQD